MNFPDSNQNDDLAVITPKWYEYMLTPLGVSSVLALILANGLLGWYALSNRERQETTVSQQTDSNLVKANVQPTIDQPSNLSKSLEGEVAHQKSNNQTALVETLLPAAVRLPQLQTSIPEFEQLISSAQTEGLFYVLAPYRYDYLQTIAGFKSAPALQIVALNGSPQIYLGAYTQAQAQQLLKQLQDEQISAYIYSES